MTVGHLHKSQRFIPCKCTLATYFIHALFGLVRIYIQYWHEIRIIKNGLAIKSCTASW